MAELVNDKVVDGIARIKDESDRTGMRIVIELKRDATTEVVLNQLFKLTPMQESFGIINLAIVDGKPMVCTAIELLSNFTNHRRNVITRRTEFELRKALKELRCYITARSQCRIEIRALAEMDPTQLSRGAVAAAIVRNAQEEKKKARNLPLNCLDLCPQDRYCH